MFQGTLQQNFSAILAITKENIFLLLLEGFFWIIIAITSIVSLWVLIGLFSGIIYFPLLERSKLIDENNPYQPEEEKNILTFLLLWSILGAGYLIQDLVYRYLKRFSKKKLEHLNIEKRGKSSFTRYNNQKRKRRKLK